MSTTPSSTPASAVRISGIHHITAVASAPQANLDFYVGVLGLRLVKRTVNFDDPGTYHFYFADAAGRPGTVFTTFPWAGAARGRQGNGFLTATAFAVPRGSLVWWSKRLAGADVKVAAADRLGDKVLALEDHDGMRLELVESDADAGAETWEDGLPVDVAIRGFHAATLSVADSAGTARLLTEIFGMRPVADGADGDAQRLRFVFADAPSNHVGRFVDLLVTPGAGAGRLGAGVVHHLALRARDPREQQHWQRLLAEHGVSTTPVRDRQYFQSIYFREPGGVIFEIATDGPGFATDEPASALGTSLKLPPQFESARARLESKLAPVRVPAVRKDLA